MASFKEKIGQLLMIGLRGTELSAEERNLRREYSFGGFILFNHNLKEPEQILTLCRSLWEIGGEISPFIAINQEGWRVDRLLLLFIDFPPAPGLGQTAMRRACLQWDRRR